jgi:repressor LexA
MMTREQDMERRLQKIMEFLTRFQVSSGYSPSIREIGDEIGVGSTSLVDFYLDKLADRGDIIREKHISRSIRVIRPAQASGLARAAQAVKEAVRSLDDVLRIPIIGQIQAGIPITVPSSDLNYFDAESSVEIARGLLPAKEKDEDVFALTVKGDSMIDAMVSDGDIIIMKKAVEAHNGEMVAIWLDDENETTLKYFYKEKDRIRLQPANPTMQPIYIARERPLRIMGTVIMVIRQIAKSPLAA